MAQASLPPAQAAPIEQSYGQYSVHFQGNSLSVTVPRPMNLSAETPVSMRVGRYEGRVVYLKAVPLDAAFAGLPGTQPVTEIGEDGRITETEIDVFSVRGGNSEDKALTIPAKCKTERFERKTEPMLVCGTVEGEVAYLRLIPECLYERTGSIDVADIVRTMTNSGSFE
jgi:hypothetical protein